jgi:hypothetical protein
MFRAFAQVPTTEQFSNHFIDDLRRLAMILA